MAEIMDRVEVVGQNRPALLPNTTYIRCNFAQAEPGTKIGEGVPGLRFVQCNLVNCVVPDDAVVERCCTAQVEPSPPISEAERKRQRIEELRGLRVILLARANEEADRAEAEADRLEGR